MSKQPCVYILASRRNGTLYVGVTANLFKRVWEHKNDLVTGFAERYGVHQLVWFEQHAVMESAIAREKAIKEWKRAWKLRLIEENNPHWRDLYAEIIRGKWRMTSNALDPGLRRDDGCRVPR
jgi:putative endonuclease